MLATPGTGLIGIVVLLILLVAGMPVGVALGLVGIVGLAITLGPEPALIKSGVIVFDTLTRYELGTLPLFLLIAHLTLSANASRDFFDAAARFVGHRRGGLAIASVGGCAGFSAINGSSLATAATIGLVAFPEMRSRGYSDALAAGAVAAGGTLGPMIPPSAALIVFGIIAQQSIGTLFTAAIIPGITQTLLYFAVVWILVRIKPSIAPPMEKASWAERLPAVKRIADVSLLIVIMIGGIVVGWFSPSEAASVGVVGTPDHLRSSTAAGLGHASTCIRRDPEHQRPDLYDHNWRLDLCGLHERDGRRHLHRHPDCRHGRGPSRTTLVIALFLLALGSVLDGLALMLLTTPILLPIVTGLGMSPIWFGIYLVRTMEIGFVHPPIGMNLYVIQTNRQGRPSQPDFQRRFAVSCGRSRARAVDHFISGDRPGITALGRTMTDIERVISRILADPLAAARTARRAIGYVGPDLPFDMLLASDLFPCHLPWDADRPHGRSAQWLETSFAPWTFSMLDSWLEGEFDFFEFVLFSRGDNSSQRLYYYICELQRQGLAAGPTPLIFDVAHVKRPTSLAHTVASVRDIGSAAGDRRRSVMGGDRCREQAPPSVGCRRGGT